MSILKRIILSILLLSSIAALLASPLHAVPNNNVDNQISNTEKAANFESLTLSPKEKAQYHSDLKKHLRKMKLEEKEENKIIKWIFGVLGKIINWMEKLFDRQPKTGVGFNFYDILRLILRVLVYVIAISAVLGVLYLIYLLLRNYLRSVTPKKDRVQDAAVVENDGPTSGYNALLANADELFLRGNLYEAVRNLYLASIALLIDAQMITYTKDRTNREYLRSLANKADAGLTSAFRDITRLFDAMVYGGRLPGAEEYESARKCVTEMDGML